MENMADAQKYAETAANSTGNAIQKYEDSYLKGIQGATNAFKATFEEMSNNFVNSDLLVGVVNLGEGLMKVVNFLAETKALLPAIIAGFMQIKNVGKLNNQNMPAYAQLPLAA